MSFDLQVISRMPSFDGKIFKSYHLEGQDCIGVWGDEEFELCFRNTTRNKVQVRLSLDGTDVATGKLAHTGTSTDGMWVVGAYDTLKLRAWVETNQKGRHFVFATPGNEVARHMHGDLSNKGIIAAAVFTEGYVGPPPPVFYDRFLGGYSGGITIGGGGNYSANATPGIYGEVKTKGAVRPPAAAPAPARSFERRETSLDFMSLDCERAVEISEEAVAGPGVGAGREIIQKIGTAQGLVRPVLDRIITLKYMWYDDLVKKLESRGFVREGAQPNGFPGDREKRFMDLSHVPVAGATAPAPVVHRFA